MVLEYFNLREHPFGVTPDSNFLFLGDTHREALASITYGIEAGCGFVALIATPGLGKTTLLFHAMNQLRDEARTVFLFQTVCTPLDLLRALLTGLGIREYKGTLTEMQLKLKDVLLEEFHRGKRVVLVIDEAQNLDDSVLELVRMLSNFETAREKLIQIVLSGQPQLAEKIGSPELIQLRQRVSIIARLKPFSAKETALYMEHRLRTAGYSFDVPLFTKDAHALIAEYSEGIPRNINNLCFNALALGCALKQKPIDAGIVREVVGDLSLDRFHPLALAAPRQETVPSGLKTFLPRVGEASWLGGTLGKVAVSAAVVLALGAALFVSQPWKTTRVAGQTKSVPPGVSATQATTGSPAVTSALPPAPEQTQAGPQPAAAPPAALAQAEAGTDTVQITPGKTLLRICVDHFGKCGPEILKEIHRLNPSLSDLDHIEVGQSLRIPATPRVSRASAAEPVPKGSGATRE